MNTGHTRTIGSQGRIAALFAVAAVVAASTGLLRSQAGHASTLADLKVVHPVVTVRDPGRSAAVTAASGHPLAAGAQITTGAAGIAAIEFFDGSMTRIGPDTRYRIEELARNRGGRVVAGRLDVGRTWHRVKTLSQSDSRFEVRTANAVAAVRGTTFGVECLVARRCLIAVTEGAVLVQRGADHTLVHAGHAVLVDDDDLGALRLIADTDTWVQDNLALDRADDSSSAGSESADDGSIVLDESRSPSRFRSDSADQQAGTPASPGRGTPSDGSAPAPGPAPAAAPAPRHVAEPSRRRGEPDLSQAEERLGDESTDEDATIGDDAALSDAPGPRTESPQVPQASPDQRGPEREAVAPVQDQPAGVPANGESTASVPGPPPAAGHGSGPAANPTPGPAPAAGDDGAGSGPAPSPGDNEPDPVPDPPVAPNPPPADDDKPHPNKGNNGHHGEGNSGDNGHHGEGNSGDNGRRAKGSPGA
ncbi:MAG TPA: FecR domain-containing protein [Acidimicrobiales bacterium]|nr:FecR domain-containing protein [Acidimicrobiales bacterium]